MPKVTQSLAWPGIRQPELKAKSILCCLSEILTYSSYKKNNNCIWPDIEFLMGAGIFITVLFVFFHLFTIIILCSSEPRRPSKGLYLSTSLDKSPSRSYCWGPGPQTPSAWEGWCHWPGVEPTPPGGPSVNTEALPHPTTKYYVQRCCRAHPLLTPKPLPSSPPCVSTHWFHLESVSFVKTWYALLAAYTQMTLFLIIFYLH